MFLSCYCWCDCERFLVDVLVDVLHAVRFFAFFLFFLSSLLFSARIIVVKNRSCVTVFGSCSMTLTVGEPLEDVSGSANHDFRTSVTGISGEIDASLLNTPLALIRLIALQDYLLQYRTNSSNMHWTNSTSRTNSTVSVIMGLTAALGYAVMGLID